MRILVTGHTGFKGSWLSLLLAERGHQVHGIALDPLRGGVFQSARLTEMMASDARVDVRDAAAMSSAVAAADPEVVFHLAAQPLVRESYRDPRTTFETNTMGTLNLLETLDKAPRLRAAVVVTTDKVYRNVGRVDGYVETDALGGDDPYSASKAMADILTHSWMTSFPGVPTAIARGGNVIGGGDMSKDRLLVDLIEGFRTHHPAKIRSPDSVRPWQHVLDCLSGYLTIADALLHGSGAGPWNIGPDPGQFQSVRMIADTAAQMWGDDASWIDESQSDHPHEAALLTLNPGKSKTELGSQNLLPFPDSVRWTVDWQREVDLAGDSREVTSKQIARYIALWPDAPWMRSF